ncbi:MAG: adenine methylase [Sphingomonadales bacterium]|jgi:DNA adenine methylase|nr:adenine methylase [Sphingomonadales bacterium]
MKLISSPLRYPGGKAKLFPFFADLIQVNQLFGCEYREPYAGGAGLALNLLAGGFVSRIHINDLDSGIFAFWRTATQSADKLCSLVSNARLDIEEWYRQREVWRRPHEHSEAELGFATLFLNRANRSGIIEGAGPVGGYHQSGSLRLDARFNKQTVIDRIQLVGALADRISVSNVDALEYIQSHTGPNDLTYLDPPYYVRGQRLYKNFYNHHDHVAISQCVRNMVGSWVVSYDDVGPIRELYSWLMPLELTLRYTAGTSATGREIVYFSSHLEVGQERLRVA